jgi:hexokinase
MASLARERDEKYPRSTRTLSNRNNFDIQILACDQVLTFYKFQSASACSSSGTPPLLAQNTIDIMQLEMSLTISYPVSARNRATGNSPIVA